MPFSRYDHPHSSIHAHNNTSCLPYVNNSMLLSMKRPASKSINHFLSMRLTPHIPPHTMTLSVLHKIPTSYSWYHHTSFPYRISCSHSSFFFHFTISWSILLDSNSLYSLKQSHPILVLAIIAPSILHLCLPYHTGTRTTSLFPLHYILFLLVNYLSNTSSTFEA